MINYGNLFNGMPNLTLDDKVKKVFRTVMAQREEILTAFIAQHGCKPDEIVQVIKHGVNATTYEVKLIPKKKKQKAVKPVSGLCLQLFEQAWELYGKKGSKPVAMRYWAKLTKDDITAILKKIPDYTASVSERCYMKDFQGWINPANRLWEAEIVIKMDEGDEGHGTY